MSSTSSSAGDGAVDRALQFVRVFEKTERIGDYAVVRLLGRGGMGSVWEATGPRGRVAVKLLHRNFTAEWKDTVRIVREGSLASAVRHPNVVRVLDIDACELGLYVVMELVDGRPLDAAVRRMPMKDRLRLLVQAARGLQAAHAAGIVHRDMKPANVLVDRAGRACITDFGLACALDGDRITGTSTSLGTPYYMAPEQVRRDHDAVDARTDVWALGVMMYELMADANPFRGDVESVLYRDPPRIFRAWPYGLREPLLRVCWRALAKEQRYRHANAGKFANALEDALAIKVRRRLRTRPLVRRRRAPR